MICEKRILGTGALAQLTGDKSKKTFVEFKEGFVCIQCEPKYREEMHKRKQKEWAEGVKKE
jgi:hypothetical protein